MQSKNDGQLVVDLSPEQFQRLIKENIGATKALQLATAQRKETEEALRDSEESYRTLLNSIDDGFCVIEVLFDDAQKPIDYRFLQVNASFEAQTGLVNVIGQKMRALAPSHEAHWFEIYGKVGLGGQPMRFKKEAKALNRWYDVYALRVGPPQRRQVAVLFKDITERKRQMQEYQRVMERLEQSEAALHDKVRDLELFHDVVVDRELKMMALEKEVSMLQERLARWGDRWPGNETKSQPGNGSTDE